MYVMMFMS